MIKKIKIIPSGKPLVGFPFFMLLLLLASPLSAQVYEIGVGVGGFNYTGDLYREYRFKEIRPGATIFSRNNLTKAVSLRFAAAGGWIQGSDGSPRDILGQQREASFSNFIAEGTVQMEYYFLDFKSKYFPIKWSPYLTMGAGLFTLLGQPPVETEYSTLQPVIPIGFGFKYLATKTLNLEMEFGIRKTFLDEMDGISEGDLSVKNYQFGIGSNSDTYYFLSFSVSYNFYDIPCPYDPK